MQHQNCSQQNSSMTLQVTLYCQTVALLINVQHQSLLQVCRGQQGRREHPAVRLSQGHVDPPLPDVPSHQIHPCLLQ